MPSAPQAAADSEPIGTNGRPIVEGATVMVTSLARSGKHELPALKPYRATVTSIETDAKGLVVHLTATSRNRARRMARPSDISVERIPRKPTE